MITQQQAKRLAIRILRALHKIYNEKAVLRSVNKYKLALRLLRLAKKRSNTLEDISDEELEKRLTKIVAWEALSMLTKDMSDEEREIFINNTKRMRFDSQKTLASTRETVNQTNSSHRNYLKKLVSRKKNANV